MSGAFSCPSRYGLEHLLLLLLLLLLSEERTVQSQGRAGRVGEPSTRRSGDRTTGEDGGTKRELNKSTKVGQREESRPARNLGGDVNKFTHATKKPGSLSRFLGREEARVGGGGGTTTRDLLESPALLRSYSNCAERASSAAKT